MVEWQAHPQSKKCIGMVTSISNTYQAQPRVCEEHPFKFAYVTIQLTQRSFRAQLLSSRDASKAS